MIEPTLSSLSNSTLKRSFRGRAHIIHVLLFFGAIWSWSCVTLKKNNYSFRGPSWGGYLCPYGPICPYMSLRTYVPSLDFKTCRFVNNNDEETMPLLVFYYCIWDCPYCCRNFNTIFMSFVANSSMLLG